MKRAIGERRREAEERVDGEGFEFGLEMFHVSFQDICLLSGYFKLII